VSCTALDVLLTHGLHATTAARLRAVFTSVEQVASSLSHHESGVCTSLGPQPCPWQSGATLARDVGEVTVAVNAWCAVGWLERDV
jgi:hypothetical protein